MAQEEKIDYCALIEQLAGKVYDTMYFNPACTHVVVGKPNRFALSVWLNDEKLEVKR